MNADFDVRTSKTLLEKLRVFEDRQAWSQFMGLYVPMIQLARQRYVSPDGQALVFIGLGDKDQAFSWLEKVVADRSEWLCKFGVDPVLDPLRSDPRFKALLRQANGASLDREVPAERL